MLLLYLKNSDEFTELLDDLIVIAGSIIEDKDNNEEWQNRYLD